MLWQSDSPTVRQCDRLTSWQSNNLAVWHTDSLKVWLPDILTVWQSKCLTVSQFDILTIWQSDILTVWQSDSLTVWQLDILTVHLSSLALWLPLHPILKDTEQQTTSGFPLFLSKFFLPLSNSVHFNKRRNFHLELLNFFPTWTAFLQKDVT